MKTQEQIIARINILTSIIGHLQEKLYDLALQNNTRKIIWKIHDLDKKMVAAYNEVKMLEWVLDDKIDGETEQENASKSRSCETSVK